MRCPACQFAALEGDAACRQCGFSLDMADQAFGIPPVLEHPVTDLAGELSGSERARIEKIVHAIERRFPQVTLAIAIAAAPAGVPPAAWAFWLFNRGSLFSPVERGGDNHGVLLAINTADNSATLTLGYGLEPFIAETALRQCLQEAAAELAKARYAVAVQSCMAGLDRELTKACGILPRAFGYAENGTWIDAAMASTVALPERQAEDLF